MIWVKAFHIIFMVAWFAGLFYLPRLFVNHAMAEEEEVKARLRLMERKLYRFITPWMVLTLVFGFWLLFDYAWAAYAHMLWLHVKLALVAALVVYHFYCGKLLRDFANENNRRSHVWYRWFNELPVLVLFAAVILAVVKPF
ncbi:MAG: protoporphyrinogen oxidase HemJ [Gammaproteobacteria bacterium]|jgi:putative membrane protein|nr:protoporphyrinogen oxidase HemJ [Gammaproteobacteria bacterium]